MEEKYFKVYNKYYYLDLDSIMKATEMPNRANEINGVKFEVMKMMLDHFFNAVIEELPSENVYKYNVESSGFYAVFNTLIKYGVLREVNDTMAITKIKSN